MKKVLVTALIVAAGLSLAGLAYAHWSGSYGPGAGSKVDVQALRSFQKDTLPLRDEVAAKRLELQNEYAKGEPDQTRIATLEKEISGLRAKIQDAATKYGISDRGYGWMSGPGGWGHGSMMGRGYGHGYMMGQGYGRGDRGGYGSDDCPMW